MFDAFLSPKSLERISQKLPEQEHRPGLYVVATPIGNIFDITLRAIYILKKAKYIFAEDTRVSRKLLNFYDLKTPLITCHEYNETDESVVSLIKATDVCALISDAGTPLISDPGYRLVNWCRRNGVDVFPIPGPCSFVAGLSAAGLPTDSFLFQGFLPAKSRARKSTLENIKPMSVTSIFLESPKRLTNTLTDMLEIFGDRFCCVCREITKIFEEFKRGNLSELVEYFSKNEPMGECIILVSGDKNNGDDLSESEMFIDLSKSLQNSSLKNAVKEILKKHRVSRNVAYKKALEIKEKNQ